MTKPPEPPLQIIHPNAGPGSTPRELEKWLEELRGMEQTPEVEQAIADAKFNLQLAIDNPMPARR